MSRHWRTVLVLLISISGVVGVRAASVTAVPIAEGVNQPAAIDFQPGTDAMLVSVAGNSGLETISTEGERTRFGRSTAVAAGAPITVVKDQSGEFGEGDIFTAYRDGQLIKVAPDGTVEADPWVALPGEHGRIGALHVDRTGVFGGDVLAGTATGDIWRIDERAKPRFIAATGEPIVALLAIPDAEKFGPWAGKLLAATAEGGRPCRILVVSPSGEFTEMNPGFCVADLAFVLPEADLFVAARGSGQRTRSAILKIPSEELAPFVCQIGASDPAGALVVFSPATTAFMPTRFDLDRFSPRGLAFGSASNLCQPEKCADGEDNNNDGSVDEDCEEICSDGIDNDSNGEVDDGCAEVCGDGEDNDKNGVVDDGCMEICGDGVDNDGDGDIDAPCSEICGDSIDNDQDGVVDGGCPLPVADAGCPGKTWLLNPKEWVGLEPIQLAGTVFSLTDSLAPLSLDPLSTALQYPGGTDTVASAKALVRAATAALLNADNPKVGYPLTSVRVLQQTNAALESGRRPRIDALASVLDALNVSQCSLPAAGAPAKIAAPAR